MKAPPTVNVQSVKEDDERELSVEVRQKSKRSVSPLNIDPDERYPSFHSPKPDKTAGVRSKSKSPLLVPADEVDVPKRNLIPTGRQIERTPQVDLPKQTKVPPTQSPPEVDEKDADVSETSPHTSGNLSRLSEGGEDGNVEATPELEPKKNVIPLGAQIPR